MSTHKYDFDRQENQIAMLKTISKTDLQDYFEKLFFQEGRANRLDMHWNSQSQKPDEEVKEAEPAADNVATEEEPQPTYETEFKHSSVNQFKMSMGLFRDNFMHNYATK